MTFPSSGRDDDPLAARLRAALTSEADMVQPSDDGLQNIRAGIDETRRRPWWRHPATPARCGRTGARPDGRRHRGARRRW